jgi:type I restriction enzyme, S subunit
MSMAWRRVKLGEVAKAQAGFAFKSDRFTDLPEDVPLVKGENVSQGRILWDISKRWPAEEWPQFAKYHLHAGDVVVAMDRPWVPAGLKWSPVRNGDPPALLVQRVARLRSANGRLEQSYLPVLIGSPAFNDYLRPITTGVNVPHVSARQILDLEFHLPPVRAQRRIAAILAAYDDLIETSIRRIQILEEVTQATYREWFVRFRFPGHEAARRMDSPLGSIPSGWGVAAFTEIADVLSGGTPKTSTHEYWGGGIPFFTPRDAPDGYFVHLTEKTITDAGLQNCASELYPVETIFITARGTVGKIALTGVPMAMNQSCYALRGRHGLPQRLLFQLLRERLPYLKTNTGGATFDTIIVDTFRRMIIVRPPDEIIDLYAASPPPSHVRSAHPARGRAGRRSLPLMAPLALKAKRRNF